MTPPEQLDDAEQLTWHEVPPHAMGPLQALPPVQPMVQLVAAAQSMPPAHELAPLQFTEQGIPAGHFTTESLHALGALQSITHRPATQVPIPVASQRWAHRSPPSPLAPSCPASIGVVVVASLAPPASTAPCTPASAPGVVASRSPSPGGSMTLLSPIVHGSAAHSTLLRSSRAMSAPQPESAARTATDPPIVTTAAPRGKFTA